ncbi:aromatic motif membrane protein [Metamycoplasma auris]|uniref:Aromatic cluster surface protein n=1 Tax=Metamycoplasma auris TaxID=51363 RepID=A0A2W7GRS0_9BACT|nr:aromatic motif membrane protein [Metamycoplasma auris]PZV99948.1 aromatic cluster surface protein [Metamycoplasma auris]
MKKSLKIITSLSFVSLPFITISCYKTTNINHSNQQEQPKTEVSIENNPGINQLINFVSNNDKAKKDLYISNQRNIPHSKIHDLKFAFTYAPLFVFNDPIETGEYKILIHDSNQTIKNTLSRDWLWSMNNINKFKFVYHPYGDSLHEKNDKKIDEYKLVRNENGSLIQQIRNKVPQILEFDIPDMTLSSAFDKQIDELVKKNDFSNINNIIKLLKWDSSDEKTIRVTWRPGVSIIQKIAKLIDSIEKFELDEKKYNEWKIKPENKSKQDELKLTSKNFNEYIEKISELLEEKSEEVTKTLESLKSLKKKKNDDDNTFKEAFNKKIEEVKSKIESIYKEINNKLENFLSFSKLKEEFIFTKDEITKQIKDNLAKINSYKNKKGIYLVYDQNKVIRLWKYTKKEDGKDKNVIEMTPDLLIFKHKENLKNQLKSLEEKIAKERENHFVEDYLGILNNVFKEISNKIDDQIIIKNFNDQNYMAYKSKDQYNQFLFEILTKENKEKIKIFKYVMRLIDEE